MSDWIPAFIESYFVYLGQKGRRPSTIRRYVYDVHDFATWLKKKRKTTEAIDWRTISKAELERFFTELIVKRNYKVRTVRRIHSVLRQIALHQKSLGSTELQAILSIEPPELTDEPLSPREWVRHDELKQLFHSLASEQGLSEQQRETFPFYKERNLLIARLFALYGMTLQEVHQLSMKDVKFERNELIVNGRTVTLSEEDKQLAYRYYMKIPKAVRPRYHSGDPFFVAFDFNRKTYHWSYADDQPKRMTMIAIQKMIRMEVRRAGLRKGISAQTLRHTYILKKLLHGASLEEMIADLGFLSPLSLRRYEKTIAQMTSAQKAALIGNESRR